MKKILIALVAIAAVSCRGNAFLPFSEKVDLEGSLSHDMIVLGNQLEDPYSVDNMTKALASLYPTKAGRVPVTATDLYVKFHNCSFLACVTGDRSSMKKRPKHI